MINDDELNKIESCLGECDCEDEEHSYRDHYDFKSGRRLSDDVPELIAEIRRLKAELEVNQCQHCMICADYSSCEWCRDE